MERDRNSMCKGPVRRGSSVNTRSKEGTEVSGGNRSKAAQSNKNIMRARYVT